MTEHLLNALSQAFPQKQILQNAPMSRYTTLRLGGPADVLVEVADGRQLSAAITIARELDVPVMVLGNGSNLLVRDGGIRGLVIHLGDLFAEISEPAPLPDGRFALTAQTGAPLQKLANRAADAALTGLEFAGGIPGTVGGAVYMNAGAYGGEMKDVVSGITAVTHTGETVSFSAQELDLSYRHSRLSQLPQPCVAASVTVTLQPGDRDTIRAAMRELNARRREKQPLTLPSCGSTFKRPEGQFAGTLIEQCGLKGARVGGASVSTLHAGFLVNDRQGTAADYLALIAHVQKTVFDQTGVRLEPEVRIIGEENPAQII
ncbi:MAG: UDP-N-acetylmuramate dehydrogenase [Clostridiales bacterium]|nr:UDP-N-acetylmuramate dehydrogenase [Clostridiales bacterium]